MKTLIVGSQENSEWDFEGVALSNLLLTLFILYVKSLSSSEIISLAFHIEFGPSLQGCLQLS